MEGFPPSSIEEDFNMISNELDFQSLLPDLELLSPPPEVPVNQSSISCNDQGGQNNLINDSIQQTTPFPTSFPETMMEGVPQSAEDDVNLTSNQFDLQSPEDTFMFDPELLMDQQWTDYQLTIMSNQVPAMNQRHQNSNIPQPYPRHGGFNQPGPSFPAPRIQHFPNQGQVDQAFAIPNIDNMQQENFAPRNFDNSTRDQQWTNYQLPMSNQVPAMNQWHQYSNTHQPQPGHCYMTSNATTSELCGNHIQPGPSFPAPRSQYFSNQVQVDRAAVIPNIDNVQQDNFVPRSQMDNLQVRGLQNQTATPNASNPGLGTSLQSQNRGLNTQQVEMVRSKDPFWNYIEDRTDGSMKCKFCPHPFANKTSISRIKWHLSGEEGHNVTICHGVPKEVQEAAFLAAYKRQKITASSANVNDCGISTCPQEQNIEINMVGVGEERINSHAIAGNDVVSMTGMRATEDGVSEGALESRPRTEPVDRSLEQSSAVLGNLAGGSGRIQAGVLGVLEQGAGEERINRVRQRTEPVAEDVENNRRSVQVGAGARSSESLKYNKTRGVSLPTSSTKPVGQAFEEKTKVISSLLMDGEVSTIGIYGMGGVGKSTILQHIHNELLQRPDICDHVWWVTVSQDFSIKRLQDLIAEHLDLDLSRKNNELHRAAKLSEKLRKKQKWILILDDLWNDFTLDRVGIPVKLKGCKLILTTRSEIVCRGIACDHKIQVKPLSEGEAWTLFKENLEHDIALSSKVEGIAKAIARECDGLPLGIITVAGSLRGVDDLHQWRNTLTKLRESEFRDMDEKVFKLLRLSYDRLGDVALQQCLLYCALFPEDHWIQRGRLIGYLIDEGIIKRKRSRGDAFDEGHTMLNKLENVCLLESAKMDYDGSRCFKMHDLIRDMAIQILLENSQGMVKAGAQLKELPDAEEWTENLTIVSLMQNEIEEIPSSHSPRCPYLSTLLLCQNRLLGFIADSFFKQLHGLKVLDLSYTGIENLPDSVSDMVSLTALLLNDCGKLRYVPSLKKLTALKRLNLSHTTLEKMPQGMECLTNLRYLRMNGCGEKEFPSGILPKLSHLQVFVLEEFFKDFYAPITVEGKEVGSLRNLETLECHFEGFSDFVEYLRSRDGIQSLSTYTILVGMVHDNDDFPLMSFKTVSLCNFSMNKDRDFQVKLLNDIQGLVCKCIDARSLCDVMSLENATELEHIRIRDCNDMESLVSSSWFCYAPPPLPSCNGTFSGLKEFFCYSCESMKKLFPLMLLPNLVNLERIEVSDCEKMEEIIGTTDEESSTSNSITEFILPKLRTLQLSNLPELKSICSAKLICNSLENIDVLYCEKLKRMAICLPLLKNGQPSLKYIRAYPIEWWETVVEWEHPNAKGVFRPFVESWWESIKGMR